MRVGDTFLLWVSKMDFAKSPQNDENPNSRFPKGCVEIPPFSVLEVHVISKSGDPYMTRDNQMSERFSCVRFCLLRPAMNSLYTYVPSLFHFPTTLEAARRAALERKEEFAVISKDVETQDVSFFLRSVAPTACISDDAVETTGFVSVLNWSANPMDEGTPLDISREVLLRQTNAGTLQWATTLLEIALNMGCVHFLVFCSDWFRGRDQGLSCYRAIPVLDTMSMFEVLRRPAETMDAVEATEQEMFFNTGAVHVNDKGERNEILLSLETAREVIALEGDPLPTRDLIICSRKFDVPKALPFYLVLRGREGLKKILRGFLRVDASPAGGVSCTRKRVRLADVPMVED